MSVWESSNRSKVQRFPAYVEVLYLTRAEVERQFKAGKISKADFERFWKKAKAEHLEEVAIHVPAKAWPAFEAWLKTWKHKGGGFYAPGSYAVRCGGKNQSRDPVNVFFLRG